MVLSQYVEEQYATELVASRTKGVGYLLKDRVADTGDFVAALREVAGGGTVLDPEVVADPPLRRPDPGPAGLRTLVRMDLSRDRRLTRCEVPTLVLWGTEDKVNRPSGGPRLAATMPRCDLVMWSRTGHWAQWEQADRFNALAIEHIRRHA